VWIDCKVLVSTGSNSRLLTAPTGGGQWTSGPIQTSPQCFSEFCILSIGVEMTELEAY
jgi:hypothetical protein